MSKAIEVLRKNQSATVSEWREKAEWRRNNNGWLKKSQKIALQLLSAMEDRGLSQKEVAERLEVSPQYISKLLKGTENLTLETIDKLETLFGFEIININSFYDSQLTSPVVSFNNYECQTIIDSKTVSPAISEDEVNYKTFDKEAE